MALQNTDLMVVQQGGKVYKVSVDNVSTKVLENLKPSDLPIASATDLGAIKVGNNLNISGDGTLNAVIPSGVAFKGTLPHTADAPAAAPGDLYLFSTAGTLNNTWGAESGTDVQINDGIVFEENGEWNHLPGLFGVGVTSIIGQSPIEVDSTTNGASQPIIKITNATQSEAGAMSALDKLKLDGIEPGSDIGTVTEVKIVADSGLTVINGTTVPEIGLNHATTGTYGSALLADATAITIGTKGAVVDAEQLKAATDRIDSLEQIAVTTVAKEAGTPINVVESPTGTFTVGIDQASETGRGSIQIATAAEVEAGVNTDKAVTPQEVKSFYLPLDFSSLDGLP